MATKVSYANLKLKTDNTVSTFKFNDTEIEVLNYLDVESKYDLVMVTLQKALEHGVYNPLKLDMYFNLNLVYMYTNLSFTDKQRENEPKIYNALKSSGFLDAFLECLSDTEYNELYNYIQELIALNNEYRNGIAAVVSDFINNLPVNAEAAMDLVNNFDKDKYQAVVDFAEAANGGRPIAARKLLNSDTSTEG